MSLNISVIEFIVHKAKERESKFGQNFSMDCPESVEIFDELDSLLETELEPIGAVFLLGSGKSTSKCSALKEANEIGLGLVELLAFDPALYTILEKGLKLYK